MNTYLFITRYLYYFEGHTEPQNGWGWKGPLEVILSTPPRLKQDHLEQISQHHVQMAFEYLQGWKSSLG